MDTLNEQQNNAALGTPPALNAEDSSDKKERDTISQQVVMRSLDLSKLRRTYLLTFSFPSFPS